MGRRLQVEPVWSRAEGAHFGDLGRTEAVKTAVPEVCKSIVSPVSPPLAPPACPASLLREEETSPTPTFSREEAAPPAAPAAAATAAAAAPHAQRQQERHPVQPPSQHPRRRRQRAAAAACCPRRLSPPGHAAPRAASPRRLGALRVPPRSASGARRRAAGSPAAAALTGADPEPLRAHPGTARDVTEGGRRLLHIHETRTPASDSALPAPRPRPPTFLQRPPAPVRARLPEDAGGLLQGARGRCLGSGSPNKVLRRWWAPTKSGHLGPECRLRGRRGPCPATPLELTSVRRGWRASLRVLPSARSLAALCRLDWGGRQAHAGAGQRERCSPVVRQGKSPWTWRAMARLAPSCRGRGSHDSQRLRELSRLSEAANLGCWACQGCNEDLNILAVWCPGKKLPPL